MTQIQEFHCDVCDRDFHSWQTTYLDHLSHKSEHNKGNPSV